MAPHERAMVFALLYERAMAILNESEDSSQFNRFLELVGEPSNQYDIRTHRTFDFYKFGISLGYEISLKRFFLVEFMFDTHGIRDGDVERYEGTLPMGLKWSDSGAEAEAKFGIAPKSARWIQGCQHSSCDAKNQECHFRQKYVKSSLHYTLIFENAEGGLGFVGVSTPGWWNATKDDSEKNT
jgi:hypothetical protein